MGCALSSSRCGHRRIGAFQGVRVIHVNGYVEEFVGGGEMTVAHVTGGMSKIMLCTSGQLCHTGFKPLRRDDRLEPGRLYLLLPNSILQSDATPMDHAALSARLTTVAYDRATPVDIRLVEKSGTGGCARRGSTGDIRSWKPALESIDEKSYLVAVDMD